MANQLGGWAALGDAIGGGGARNFNAGYNNELRTRATVEDLMQQAAIRRNEAIALQGLPVALSALGFDHPNERAALLASKVNLAGLPDLGEAVAQSRALDAADAGDVNRENPYLAVLDKKPMEQTRVEGNTLVSPYVTPGAQGTVGGDVSTPLGNLIGEAQHAAATEHYAQAGAANALTNERNTLTPLKADYTKARTTATLHPPARPKVPSATAADDAAYLQKLQRAFAAGKTYAQIAAAAQQDGKLDLFLKHFGKQDIQDGGD